tara:strand:- start:27819 stop:28142 length:324 start_codon:yes stop_codon:yes gene_type:complete
MRRLIVDYKKLNQDILELLVQKYPDGYEESDVLTFRNANFELIEAVEVKTDDTVYLVKISKRLADTMENFEQDQDDDDGDSDDEVAVNDDNEESSDFAMEKDLDEHF